MEVYSWEIHINHQIFSFATSDYRRVIAIVSQIVHIFRATNYQWIGLRENLQETIVFTIK